MKKNLIFVGIDISKATLDVYIHYNNLSFVVENNPSGFSKLLETICNNCNCSKKQLLICFENTGKYSRMLSVFLDEQDILFVMEPALKIKKSLGMVRGKNDKIDAKRIATYAFEKQDSLTPTKLPGETIDKIKMLLSLREKLIKHRTSFKNGITDLNDCYREGETLLIKEIQQRQINNLKVEIEKIEKEISEIIILDAALKENYKLILSVKGVGKIVAFYFIAYTANFTIFNNARAFACYSGIAPFEYSSGTMKGKPRVHHYANKQIKSLLNLSAMSAIQVKGEYKQYYDKRVNVLGMNKMSTINIIRNKIVYRVFAVVNRKSPYVDLTKFAG